MSDTKTTGGPAFPNQYGLNFSEKQGMTLRDYFAAQAMNGMIAMRQSSPNHSDAIIAIAKYAYEQADEMLKAREQ
jgi:hypothetical protein